MQIKNLTGIYRSARANRDADNAGIRENAVRFGSEEQALLHLLAAVKNTPKNTLENTPEDTGAPKGGEEDRSVLSHPAESTRKVICDMVQNGGETGRLMEIARQHAVLPLLYETVCGDEEASSPGRGTASSTKSAAIPAAGAAAFSTADPETVAVPAAGPAGTETKNAAILQNIQCEVEGAARHTVMQSYHLLFLTRYLVEYLESQGISVTVLKGVSIAADYPVPELRKSGDVDLLLPEDISMDRLCQVMEAIGFRPAGGQEFLHHKAYVSPDGIETELHILPAEPFEDARRNARMEARLHKAYDHRVRREIMGISFPVLDRPYQAWQLLLHMLQHFTRAGFGLKLLCDWDVLISQTWSDAEKEELLGILKEDGLGRFASLVTGACTVYLGLERPAAAFLTPDEEAAGLFLREVFDGGEFGHSDKERMVLMKGARPTDYIREFHHQMHLNYPEKGRIVLLWPALWILTLLRFLRNNRRVRHTSTLSILKSAGKRSRRMEKLRIFDE